MQVLVEKKQCFSRTTLAHTIIAEPIAAAPAVIPQNIILKRQVFYKDVAVCPTPGEVISKLGSSTWKKKTSDI